MITSYARRITLIFGTLAIGCSDAPTSNEFDTSQPPTGATTGEGITQQSIVIGGITRRLATFKLLSWTTNTNYSSSKELYSGYDGWWGNVGGAGSYLAPGITYNSDEETAPTAVSWDGGSRADIFYVGVDHQLKHSWTTTAWLHDAPRENWGAPAGYVVYGTPGVATGGQRLDVFVLARSGSSRAIFERKYENGVLGAWTYVAPAPPDAEAPSSWERGVAAVSWGWYSGRTDLYVHQSNTTLAHFFRDESVSSSWSQDTIVLPGGSYNLPRVASRYANDIDLFYTRIDDSAVGHYRYHLGSSHFEHWGKPCAGPSRWLRGADASHAVPDNVGVAIVGIACFTTTQGPSQALDPVYLRYQLGSTLGPQSLSGWISDVDAPSEPANYWKVPSGDLILWSGR